MIYFCKNLLWFFWKYAFLYKYLEICTYTTQLILWKKQIYFFDKNINEKLKPFRSIMCTLWEYQEIFQEEKLNR